MISDSTAVPPPTNGEPVNRNAPAVVTSALASASDGEFTDTIAAMAIPPQIIRIGKAWPTAAGADAIVSPTTIHRLPDAAR